MARETEGTPTRGRGRPPRLSREQIIEAAVALVYRDPANPLTIKRVSEAVDSAPMALYRYFPDRDDLLHAVADRVASDMRFTPPKGSTWQKKLRAWMLLSMDHLRPYPQLLPYIASTRQPSWLPSFTLLTEMLSPLDLDDEDMALAIALIGTTIVGQATLAAQRTPAGEMAVILREGLDEAPTEEQTRVGPVVDKLPAAFERLYGVVIDTTIASLEALAARRGKSRKPSAKGGKPGRVASRKAPLTPIFSSTEAEV